MNETNSGTEGTYKEADRSGTRITDLCIEGEVSKMFNS